LVEFGIVVVEVVVGGGGGGECEREGKEGRLLSDEGAREIKHVGQFGASLSNCSVSSSFL
jgi:hypothetical protein